MNANLDLKNLEGNLEHYAQSADERVAEFEEVIGRLVTRFESILESVGRVVAKSREQFDNLVQMKNKALHAVEPLAKAGASAATKGKDGGKHLVKSYKKDPTPFLVGGALVLGGALITAYYLNRTRQEEINQAPIEDTPTDEEFAANAS